MLKRFNVFRASFSFSYRSFYHYDHGLFEPKLQSLWKKEFSKSSKAQPDTEKQKKYILTMFPYPSGKLHMGHVRVYTYGDCLARFHRMQGCDVMFPIGWDSFGLPAENAARERGLDPQNWTNTNIKHMREQLESLGFSFDWNREISTCDSAYFRWTQWLFLRMLHKGLAYQADATVNWDPVDETVLANEQVDAEGKSWRSGALVEQKKLRQWFLRITKYTPLLLKGLQDLETGWPKEVLKLQELWIGKSEGMYIDFGEIRVFTTKPETIFGVSFVAIAEDYPRADYWRGKTVPHPLTGKQIPVHICDYVFADYGTGAVMGVPGNDERDANFARKKGIRIISVVTEDGLMTNSGEKYDGKSVEEVRELVKQELETKGTGSVTTTYKLRDWLISRQRPWGAPIPVIHCSSCGAVPVHEMDLPVPLAPRNSPSAFREWLNVPCPKCSAPAKRDTDTMDTFVDSSWYFLRYTDPTSSTIPCDAQAWMPVDTYIGGVEHAVLHLLYARFVNMFLHKEEGISPVLEPFKTLLTQGLVQSKTFRLETSNRPVPIEEVDVESGTHKATGEAVKVSWEKMSKSKMNGVDPQQMIELYGADATRLYTMFRAPPQMDLEWDESGIQGMKRWLARLWILVQPEEGESPVQTAKDELVLQKAHHHCVVQVTKDLQRYAFNTVIPALMQLSNVLKKLPRSTRGWKNTRKSLILMLAPLAPHFSAVAWNEMGYLGSVHQQVWPSRPDMTGIENDSDKGVYLVQVDGRYRGKYSIEDEELIDNHEELILQLSNDEKFSKWINTDNIEKVIVPKNAPKPLISVVHRKL